MMTMEALLRWFINPRNSGPVLGLLLFGYYGLIGLFNTDLAILAAAPQMSELAIYSALFLLIGWSLVRGRDRKIVISKNAQLIYNAITALFLTFILLTVITAPSIPLIDAINGRDVLEISIAREKFLKAREGVFATLPYINALLTFTLVPYAMCLALLANVKGKWWLMLIFFGYSLLFVEKAFFIRVFAPLAAYMVVNNIKKIKISTLITSAIGILAINIYISGFADADRTVVEFFLYRLLEVPAQTAIDSISYWRESWNGKYFLGATNLVFSIIFQQERIPLEQLVFEYQFGRFETGTGTANAVYFIDAFLNFGYGGVIITSILLGMILKYAGQSDDPAFRCMTPLIIYSVFFGSFFSTFFGNGLLFLLIFQRFIRSKSK